MRVTFLSTTKDPGPWREALAPLLPGLDFRVWPGDFSPDEPPRADYALAWRPPPGALGRFTNLKGVLSLGAGVDHLLADPGLPRGVPLVRLVDDALTRGMVEYVAHWVLHLHRDFHLYRDLQARGQWEQLGAPETAECRVGIMGLGVLGGACARALAGFGFDVAGWSRAPRTLPGITAFAGRDGLPAFLARTQILVLLLPATPETRGLLDAATLAGLPEGAYLINPGRGELVVERDLLAALETHAIGHAVLDVFEREPLPAGHPFWTHPKVTLTPHVASLTVVPSAARAIAANILRIEHGEPPFPVADPERGF